MKEELFLLIILFVFCVCGDQSCEENDSCNTFDGSKGTWKNAHNCEFTKSLKGKLVQTAHKLKCNGSGYRQMLVCCPYNAKAETACNNLVVPLRPIIPVDNIVGGIEAEVAEFPHFASIGYIKREKA